MTTLIAPILETIIKSSVILGFAFLATLALRRQSAALKHTVWTVGLFSALAVPLFSLVMPAWHVKPVRALHEPTILIAPQTVATEFRPVPVSSPAPIPSTPSPFTPERVLLLVWVIGVLSVTALLLREAIRLARVAFGASIVGQSSCRELAREISQALMLRRNVQLMRNPNASVLGTWGALRPRVLLPRESDSWSTERIRVVLGHELAHVKRNDWLVQVIAEFARAIYWFNPLFWIACAQIRRESEHACDDAAINLGGELAIDGPTYAGHVLDLVRILKHSGQPTSAALAMASPSNLERRLIAMLNPSLNRRVTGKGAALIVALLALGLTLPLAAMQSTETVRTPVSVSAPIAAVETPPQPATATLVAQVVTPPSTLSLNPSMQATGQISGKVFDPTKALVPGVQIVIMEQSSGSSTSSLTHEGGNFVFPALRPGTYSMRATTSGFQDSVASAIQVRQGQEVQVEVNLRVGPSTIIVDITASSVNGCTGLIGTVKADGTRFTIADCPSPGVFPERIAPIQRSSVQPDDILILSTSPFPAVEVQPQPVGRRPPLRVGGDLLKGPILYHPNPAYPSAARNEGIQGFVVIGATINEDGTVQSVGVIDSSNSVFETPTMETIRLWKFKPTLLNAQPIATTATITVSYYLVVNR
jgi:TonB family protein